MKIFLFGQGKMGKQVAQIARLRHHDLVHSLEKATVCIDFSVAEVVIDHVAQACRSRVPIIIGTTGWEKDLPQAQALVYQSGNAALYSPNFSCGVALFCHLLRKARDWFSQHAVAGIEYHHEQKQDCPSGTAKKIAQDLQMPHPFAHIRCGTLVGTHEVLFDSPEETISLKHAAKNREGFARGAVQAAEWILQKQGWFTLNDMLHSTDHTI